VNNKNIENFIKNNKIIKLHNPKVAKGVKNKDLILKKKRKSKAIVELRMQQESFKVGIT
jgi:hypothetical protein